MRRLSYVVVLPGPDGLRLVGPYRSLRMAEGWLEAHSWEHPEGYVLPLLKEDEI